MGNPTQTAIRRNLTPKVNITNDEAVPAYEAFPAHENMYWTLFDKLYELESIHGVATLRAWLKHLHEELHYLVTAARAQAAL